jgi:hypothetical protein
VHRHQVQHPRRLFVERARPARAQDGAPLAQDLGLHEEIAEGRMQRIGRRRCDHHFGVTGDLDGAALPRAIGDAHPAQFDVVLRRDDDLGMGLESPARRCDGIAAAELGAALGEDRLVALGPLARRLMAGRPEGAARLASSRM